MENCALAGRDCRCDYLNFLAVSPGHALHDFTMNKIRFRRFLCQARSADQGSSKRDAQSHSSFHFLSPLASSQHSICTIPTIV